jgi:hypothetical protein
MDLTQLKLSKSEWISIEIPVSIQEKKILNIINSGYTNINIRSNDHESMISIMKMNYSLEIEQYLYLKYFDKDIQLMIESPLLKKTSIKETLKIVVKSMKPPKKGDLLRLNNMDHNIEKNKEKIFEFIQLKLCTFIITAFERNKDNSLVVKKKHDNYSFYLYTLIQMKKSTIIHSNKFVNTFIDFVIETVCNDVTNIQEHVFYNVYNIIEKNQYLLKYEDNTLHEHQKKLFQVFHKSEEKKMLVLYTAATGLGKTISPIGLSVGNKIIFICAARHVGLALAKSAISIGKCVAFAFGCESANDIRLHYYSAVEYTKNKKSGSIAKVDNSDGSKVEIMICDIASYLTAMFYMLSFNSESQMILYWDEPTITLDKVTHPLHEIIHKNWSENKISKVVLSSATLPLENQIRDVLDDFRSKFEGSEIHYISSFDCKKTISLIDVEGKCVLPHLLFPDYNDIQISRQHCLDNKSLLRYFDLRELVRFVQYTDNIIPESYMVKNYFSNVADITMDNVKVYYLELLKQIPENEWKKCHDFLKSSLISRISPKTKSTGILLTTVDAHTLTDGPTIFIAEDVVKIGKFYIQQSQIPVKTFEDIMKKIDSNNQIQKKMDVLNKSLEDCLNKESDKKIDKNTEEELSNQAQKKITNSIDYLRTGIKMITMDSIFIPNTIQHQNRWVGNQSIIENAFTPIIEETTVKQIMELDVDNQMKLLLLLGIGVIDITNKNVTYMEIMKRLAAEQKMFLIIASSDYIYGTNYQLCHGILGKDLLDMTQQKVIQAIGRVGRGHIQQEYTVRFRDDAIISKLFLPSEDNLEANNICRLFKV